MDISHQHMDTIRGLKRYVVPLAWLTAQHHPDARKRERFALMCSPRQSSTFKRGARRGSMSTDSPSTYNCYTYRRSDIRTHALMYIRVYHVATPRRRLKLRAKGRPFAEGRPSQGRRRERVRSLRGDDVSLFV